MFNTLHDKRRKYPKNNKDPFKVGILPGGTGNDFYKSMGGKNPKKKKNVVEDTLKLIEQLKNGSFNPIDVGRKNNDFYKKEKY